MNPAPRTVSDVVERFLHGSGKLYQVTGSLPDGQTTDVKVRGDNIDEAQAAATILFNYFRPGVHVHSFTITRIAAREIK